MTLRVSPPSRSRVVAGAAVLAALAVLVGTVAAASPVSAYLVGTAATVSPVSAYSTAGVADLQSDIDEILADPALEGAVSGVVVRSFTEGDELYSNEPDASLIPASNAKLFTSAAALAVLGPDYRFRTTISAEATPGADGVLDANLYLTGTGDPTLTPDAYQEVAAEVASAGVEVVTGDLLADDTWFDAERLAPDWDPEDEPFAFAAQISALTVAVDDVRYDTGAAEITVAPAGTEGEPVAVDVGAAEGYVAVDNEAVTTAEGSASTLQITRPLGSNTIRVTGSYPADGSDVTALRTVDEPTDYATHVLAEALADEGVEVLGDTGRATTLEGAVELVERESIPLGELLVPFLKLSNNGHAEILLRTLGRVEAGEGSWDAGLVEAETALKEIGIDTSALTLTDGSGLSRTNQVTADLVTDLLTEVGDEPWHPMWFDALPVAGEPELLVGGTLAARMVDTEAAGNVVAKTGTLGGVSGLSGYATGAGGEELVFSVVNNGHAGAAPTHVQDAIAIRLAEFDRAVVTEEPEPVPQTLHSTESPIEVDLEPGTVECSWDLTC